jgi:parallel beta helix pectate lyase-like protein
MGNSASYRNTGLIRALALAGALVLTLFASLWVGFVGVAKAQIYVGPTDQYRSLNAAVFAARPGETIYIAPGTYFVRDLAINKQLTLIGEGSVVLKSRRPVAKGLLVPLAGVSLTVENLIFEGARSPDLNGAGIRHEGALLTVRNSEFRENENGILATGNDGSEVIISGSRFYRNGHGDGYSHGIYVSVGSRLMITDSIFDGTRVGHHVKSLAGYTYISNVSFVDGDGEPSYMVDASKGGVLIIEDSEFTRAASASQDNFFNYDTTRGGERRQISLRRNLFRNAKSRGNLLRNPERVAVEYRDNEIINLHGAALREPKDSGPIAMSSGGAAPASVYYTDPALAGPVPSASVENESDAVGEYNGPHIYSEDELAALTPLQRRRVLQLQEKQKAQSEDYVPDPLTAPAAMQDMPYHQADSGPVNLLPQSVRGFASPDIVPNLVLAEVGPVKRQSSAGTGGKGSGNEFLSLPDFAARTTSDDIVPLNLSPLSGGGARTSYVSFGQVFRESAFFPGEQSLGFRIGDNIFPVQSDGKAFYANGSLKHGVLTVRIPRSLNNRNWQAMLVRQDLGAAEIASLTVPEDFTLEITITGRDGDGNDFSEHLALRDILQQALNDGRAENWLSGPQVQEFSTSVRVEPLLTIRIDFRLYGDGVIRTVLSFENQDSFSRVKRDLVYDVDFGDGNVVFDSEQSIAHHRASNWRKTIWQGGLPSFDVVHDPKYLRSAFAVPPLDLDLPASRASVQRLIAQNNKADKGKLSKGIVEPYMPESGGRDDLGPVPNWTALWLKSAAPGLKQVMLDQGDASGSAPWHFNDEDGQPIRVDHYPKFWADARGSDEKGASLPQVFFDSDDAGWFPDHAHKPALAMVPYLITGDQYYRRALSHEAGYALSGEWPDLRGSKGDKSGAGLLVVEQEQPRARAWALRDLSDAAFILPDDDPLKDYFVAALEQNLAYLRRSYVDDGRMDAAGEVEGWFDEVSKLPPGRISPWQNDYMAMVIGLAALRGSVEAGEVMAWLEPWQVGRFLAEGADPRLGPAYAHIARDPQTLAPYNNWQKVMDETRKVPNAMEVYADDGNGYLASAYGALAMVYLTTGSERAITAMEVLNREFADVRLFDATVTGGVYDQASMINGLISLRGQWESMRKVGVGAE